MYDAIQKLMMAKKIQYATILASLFIEYHYTTATILIDRHDRVQLYEQGLLHKDEISKSQSMSNTNSKVATFYVSSTGNSNK